MIDGALWTCGIGWVWLWFPDRCITKIAGFLEALMVHCISKGGLYSYGETSHHIDSTIHSLQLQSISSISWWDADWCVEFGACIQCKVMILNLNTKPAMRHAYIYILCTYMMFTDFCGIELFCFFNDSAAALTCWSLLIHAALRPKWNGGTQRSRRKTGRPRWWRLQQPLERSRINEN